MNDRSIVVVLLIAACWSTLASANPPRVVKATPDNGAVDVSPGTRHMVIVFDQAMNPSGRSIVGGGETFPRIDGDVRWPNDHTLIVPIKLEPDHDYWLSINNFRFRNFVNAKGESAEPYPIAFSTAAAADAKPDVALNQQSIKQLRKAIDDQYSYRDLRGLDWEQLFAANKARLEQSASAKIFARRAGSMLAEAKDIHIWLKVGEQTFASFRRDVPPNANLATLPLRLSQYHAFGDGAVMTAKFDDGITYIAINNWSTGAEAQFEHVFDAIKQADKNAGIILDVRCNSGGDETLAQRVAGCFVDQSRIYSKDTIRHDGKWSEAFDRVVDPNKSDAAFAGPVVVLQGKYCMSSNESFVLMMRAAGSTLVGERTFGASGNPKPVELANGVVVFLPSWKDMSPDGTVLEGQGIKPDIEVKSNAADFERGDPVLDAGLKALRDKRKAT